MSDSGGCDVTPPLRVRRAALVLVALLILAGCTAPPRAADEVAAPSPTAADSSSPAPAAVPSAASMEEGWGFVTVDADEYAIAPTSEAWELVVAWAEDYCEAADLTPCAGIADRVVPLCIEKWDCHPALLLPFEEGTAAFVSGGIFPDPQVIAVWRAESDPELAPYGGARSLLEAYLLSVGVCPKVVGPDPQGPTCADMG